MPLLGFAQAGSQRPFRRQRLPGRQGLGRIRTAVAFDDQHAYALEISGDSMKPVFRDGDVIVVSPGTPIRRGDRVVVKTSDGEVMVRELKRRAAKTLELQSLNPDACRPHARGRRSGMDRADRVGEPVADFPSPLAGDGGSHERSDCETSEGFVSANSVLADEALIRALRATFSRKGRTTKILRCVIRFLPVEHALQRIEMALRRAWALELAGAA